MLKLSEVRQGLDESTEQLKIRACKKARVKPESIKYFRVLRRSVDARDKRDVHFSCSVEMDFEAPKKKSRPQEDFCYPEKPILVVGFGPAGMFASLELARAGFKPIVVERGLSVDDRKKKIQSFYIEKILDTETNVQFGEGGAGTFSDGKLNTGVGGERKGEILEDLVAFGAPEEILVEAKPHVGSDRLPEVVKNLRTEVERLGGRVLFGTKLEGITAKNGQIVSVRLKKAGGDTETAEVSDVVLAIGHSSRDTFDTLFSSGVFMEQKDMAVGFRIEHLREDIDKSQYGAFAGHKALGAADYKLTSQAAERGVFTFCMCPGGYVVAATSEEGAVVTNGMSNFGRDGVNSNSAVVAQVKKSEYGSGVLDGIKFQREIERKAYAAGGGGYCAPCTTLKSFFDGTAPTGFGRVLPTYPAGTRLCRLDNVLPKALEDALKIGIKDMGRRIKGFDAADAVLTAAETRTSSPVRICRGENLTSVSYRNLYPAGEVGYAGGIMSSALDGLKVADKIKEKYKR